MKKFAGIVAIGITATHTDALKIQAVRQPLGPIQANHLPLGGETHAQMLARGRWKIAWDKLAAERAAEIRKVRMALQRKHAEQDWAKARRVAEEARKRNAAMAADLQALNARHAAADKKKRAIEEHAAMVAACPAEKHQRLENIVNAEIRRKNNEARIRAQQQFMRTIEESDKKLAREAKEKRDLADMVERAEIQQKLYPGHHERSATVITAQKSVQRVMKAWKWNLQTAIQNYAAIYNIMKSRTCSEEWAVVYLLEARKAAEAEAKAKAEEARAVQECLKMNPGLKIEMCQEDYRARKETADRDAEEAARMLKEMEEIEPMYHF